MTKIVDADGLLGCDGVMCSATGFFIASRVRMALKKAGVSEEEREEFWADALSGDLVAEGPGAAHKSVRGVGSRALP